MNAIFDTDKFYLGGLCLRGHDYNNTGKSLRRINDRGCLDCARIRDRVSHNKYREIRNKKAKARSSKYYYENRDEISKKRKADRKNRPKDVIAKENKRHNIYYSEHKEILNKKAKKYRERNKVRIAEHNKEYRLNNKIELTKRKAEYYKKNAAAINERAHQYRKNNQSHVLERDHRIYRNKDKDELRAYRRKYHRAQRQNNTDVAIKQRLRAIVRIGLNKYSKTGKIMLSKKYGIDYKAIIEYLGPHPNIPGIKGDFHIDHIIPLSAFDLNDPEQIKLAFAPENHQWLRARDNKVKRNKIICQLNLQTQAQLKAVI